MPLLTVEEQVITSLKLQMLRNDGKVVEVVYKQYKKRKMQNMHVFVSGFSSRLGELLVRRPENPSWLPQVAQSPQREQSSPPGQEATGVERLPWPK